MSEEEPTRLEGHLNAAEYWLNQADIYNFPNPIRTDPRPPYPFEVR